MNTAHLITGATGFVGSALVLELLQKTQDTILCLVRPKQGESAQARLLRTLHYSVDLYALPKMLHKEIDRRCFALEGDLTGELSGVTQQVTLPIQHVWHSAASLDYEERFAVEIHGINVDGTRKAIELAKSLKARYFNHVSTAYVAGSNSGTIQETLTELETPNNTYEASKILGEKMVHSATGITTRIFRPSIVVGHSATLGVLTYSGLYGFARRIVQFNAIMNRVKDGFLNANPLKMTIDAESPINFIPVDMVAQEIVRIGLSDSAAQFFHICNPYTLSVRESISAVFEAAGIALPEYVEHEDCFSDVDKKFNEKVEFYTSYLRGFKEFSRENVHGALGERNLESFIVDKQKLMNYIDVYLQTLQTKRTAKIPVMR